MAQDLPDLSTLEHYRPLRVVSVQAIDESIVAQFAKERRTVVPYEKFPQHLINAFIDAEDADFFHHPGLSVTGIFRAALHNLFKPKNAPKQGGSTITQQVVKTFLFSPEQTYTRKFKELILAYRLEKNLSKKEILYLYLNQIDFGNGCYGVQEASRFYFGKDVEQLTLAEATILAGMPKNPHRYNPLHSLKDTKRRQRYVLTRMFAEGHISEKSYFKLLHQKIKPPPFHPKLPFQDDSFTNVVRLQLLRIYRWHFEKKKKFAKKSLREIRKIAEEEFYKDGLKIRSMMNPLFQRIALNSLRVKLEETEKKLGYRGVIRHVSQEQFFKVIAQLKKNQRRIEQGKFYKALVIGENGGYYFISLGANRGLLLKKMLHWAKKRIVLEGRHLIRRGNSSRILRRGDLIWVRLSRENGAQLIKHTRMKLFELVQRPLLQGAIVIIDNTTHSVRALVNGFPFRRDEPQRVMRAREFGSLLQPFLYYELLRQRQFTMSSFVNNSYLRLSESSFMAVKNFEIDERHRKEEDCERSGFLPLSKALFCLSNRVAARLLMRVDLRNFAEKMAKLGISLSFSSELLHSEKGFFLDRKWRHFLHAKGSLWDVTNAYATLVMRGFFDRPRLISSFEDYRQRLKGAFLSDLRPLLDKGASYITTFLLQNFVNKLFVDLKPKFDFPVAGMVGYTFSHRDSWFVGGSPCFTVGVWMGYDRVEAEELMPQIRRATQELFARIIKKIHHLKGQRYCLKKMFERPDGVVFYKVDPRTGNEVSFASSRFVLFPYLPRTRPTLKHLSPLLDEE